MKDQEINTAIAESMGLIITEHEIYGLVDQGGVQMPSYTSDLNAMHEVTQTLSESQMLQFTERLMRIIYNDDKLRIEGGAVSRHTTATMIHATARQRAEAYLRTIGKWKEQS
jgi:hypothetical protein